jgi:opacity protein-like surface antigen
MLKTYAALAGAAVSVLALSAPVYAADLIIEDEPFMASPSGFDWEGAYIGVFGGYAITFGEPIFGGELGYNFLPAENFLLGIEGSVLIYPFDGDHEAFLRGKAGFVADQVAIYGLAGIGEYNFTTPLYDLGAGVEFAVADNITINGEVFGRQVWGAFPPTVLFVEGGIRFHF